MASPVGACQFSDCAWLAVTTMTPLAFKQ